MPALRVLEDEEQGDLEDDEGEEKKIKGLRNQSSPALRLDLIPVYLLYHLLPEIQYYTNHASLITWWQRLLKKFAPIFTEFALVLSNAKPTKKNYAAK